MNQSKTAIYEFRRIHYSRDGQDSYTQLGQGLALPGLICEACGNTWSDGVLAIPEELPENHPLWLTKPWPVTLDVFNKVRDEFRKALNLSSNIYMPPGTRIGLIKLACKTDVPGDFEWPVLWDIIIRDDVLDFLKARNLTGWVASSIEIMMKGKKMQTVPPPNVHQLFVTGRGGKPITEPEVQTSAFCNICGYTQFNLHPIDSLSLDENQWDGSDMFRFDAPLNGYVFVTEKFAQSMQCSNFSNYELRSVDEFLSFYNAVG